MGDNDSKFIAMEKEAVKDWESVKPRGLAVHKYEGRRVNSLVDESENIKGKFNPHPGPQTEMLNEPVKRYLKGGMAMTEETEEFWKGEFGDEYSQRNVGLVENNEHLFRECFVSLPTTEAEYDISSIIEFGAGTGMNIEALHQLIPVCKFTAVEINESAAKQINHASVYRGSIFDFQRASPTCDLVLTKGFLIHIPPEQIYQAYDIIYGSANRYILLCEYYNPTPVEVEYRGHQGKLWKRDFAGEIMDRYPDLKLIDYGFKYHRDEYPQDDLTWFLLKK